MDLDGEIGDPAHHLGAEQLHRRRRQPAIFSGQNIHCGGVTHHGPAGHHPGVLIGEHRLHELEFNDSGVPPCVAVARVGTDSSSARWGRCDRECRDVHPAAGQGRQRRALPDVLAAPDERTVADPHVGEGHVGGQGALLAHLLVLRPDRDP